MMSSKTRLTLGYNLDIWNGYGIKHPINIDLSPRTNSHILLCGMSGSGKSYLEQILLAKIVKCEPDGEIYFADYKGDDSFAYLRNCNRYYSYKDALQALDIVHSRLLDRQSGEDASRNTITLCFDEYISSVLSLISEDKKKATVVMNKVSEILLLGRSLSVRLVIATQRPDALAFPAGSRINYGVVVVLGAAVKSIYEMIMPDFQEEIKGRQFARGEGAVLLQGSELHFIKVATVQNVDYMRQLCRRGLDHHNSPCEA